MLTARVAFTGVVGGKEKRFAAGDKITDAEAKEMGLGVKPQLAKGAKVETKYTEHD